MGVLDVNFKLPEPQGALLQVIFDSSRNGFPTTSLFPDPEKRRGFLIRTVTSWTSVDLPIDSVCLPAKVKIFWGASPSEVPRKFSEHIVDPESVKVLRDCDPRLFRPPLPDGSVLHDLDTGTVTTIRRSDG